MKEKNGKAARPKYHVLFPIAAYTDPTLYAAVKSAIQKKYSFFDGNAVDAARFYFGSKYTEDDVVWHDGFLQIDEDLDKTYMLEQEEATMPIYMGGSITEGSRNNTMSHFAGRILKKFGITDKAHQLYMERAEKCEPPLSKAELDTIWKSAVKFANKAQAQDGYIPPDKFNDEFSAGSLKPEDYSDIGEAKVLSRENMDCLRFNNTTGFFKEYLMLSIIHNAKLRLNGQHSWSTPACLKDKNFANARLARNLYDDLVMNHARRVIKADNPSRDDLATIKAEDFRF